MNKDTIVHCSGNSFLGRYLYKLIVNKSIKKCEGIKEALKRRGEVKKEDIKINLVIPKECSEVMSGLYFIHRGYYEDGSLKPVKKYKFSKGRPVEENGKIGKNVIALDLYEKTIYLYDYMMKDEYAFGYILRDEEKAGNLNIIITREKVRVWLKNVNMFHEYKDVDSFLEHLVM